MLFKSGRFSYVESNIIVTRLRSSLVKRCEAQIQMRVSNTIHIRYSGAPIIENIARHV
jgi:hypothetical protein